MAPARLVRGLASAASAAPSLPPPIVEALASAPLLGLAVVPGAGRGLIVRAASIPAGTALLTAAPIAAAPAPEHGHAVCHGCLAPLGAPAAPGSPPPAAALISGGRAWCGRGCEEAAAADGWWAVERGAGGLRELEAAAASPAGGARRAARFPTLAARLASAGLVAALAGGPPPPSRAAADFLVAPALAPPFPPPWVDAYEAWVAGAARWVRSTAPRLSGDAAASAVRAAHPLPAWAADVGRAHLNAFRVEPVWPLGFPSAGALAAAAAAAVSGDAAAGSALYALPSLLNHACAPTAAPAWLGGRGRVRFVATRDLARGEAVTISYIDDDLPVGLRRAQLLDAYGFRCGCARCVEESGEAR